jgi:hypothetical protein
MLKTVRVQSGAYARIYDAFMRYGFRLACSPGYGSRPNLDPLAFLDRQHSRGKGRQDGCKTPKSASRCSRRQWLLALTLYIEGNSCPIGRFSSMLSLRWLKSPIGQLLPYGWAIFALCILQCERR